MRRRPVPEARTQTGNDARQRSAYLGRAAFGIPLLLAVTALACSAKDEQNDDDSLSNQTEALRVAVPAKIQAEAYNNGGEGVGYHDTTSGNTGGSYRQDGVDIGPTTDVGGGYGIGWIAAGEWLAYDISVATAGAFTINARVASAFPEAKKFHYVLDGKPLAGGTATLSGGDGWQSWKNVSTGDVQLPAGNHVLKIVFDNEKLNFNYLEVKASESPQEPPPGDPPPPSGSGTIVLGMYNNTALNGAEEVSSSSSFRAVIDKYYVPGKVKVRRSFNSNLPDSYTKTAGADDAKNGLVSFLSVKPPNDDIAGVASGKYDATIRSLAASMPAGSYLTMYHEPEENMTGKQFVAMFKQFYKVAKAANPKLTIGYVAMAYQWRPSSSNTTTPNDWWPGSDSTDFLGVDAYNSGWAGVHSLADASDFQRWYNWAKDKGKPLIIPEYGAEDTSTGGFSDDVRAGIIKKSLDWAATHGIKMLLYWNGTSSLPGGRNYYLNPTTSGTQDKFAGSRAAWVNAINQYGTTATTY
jgi:hypothetical protein